MEHDGTKKAKKEILGENLLRRLLRSHHGLGHSRAQSQFGKHREEGKITNGESEEGK